jgi:hypothetical protein
LPRRQRSQAKLPIGAGDDFRCGFFTGQAHLGCRNGCSGAIAQRSLPDAPRGRLRASYHSGKTQRHKRQKPEAIHSATQIPANSGARVPQPQNQVFSTFIV